MKVYPWTLTAHKLFTGVLVIQAILALILGMYSGSFMLALIVTVISCVTSSIPDKYAARPRSNQACGRSLSAIYDSSPPPFDLWHDRASLRSIRSTSLHDFLSRLESTS